MQRLSLCRLAAAMVVIGSVQAHAAQNDPLPTDFVALPDGSVNVATYFASQSFSGPWKDGVKLRSGEGSTNLFALRLNRHFSVGEGGKYTIAPAMVLTAVESEANAALVPLSGRTSSGLGDLRVGGLFWFYIDHPNREYVNAGLFMSLPTGEYNPASAVNIGENRLKTILSLGWMLPLGKNWGLELTPEIAFYGDNNRYLNNRRLTQDVAYAMTGTLRYKLTQALHLYGNAQVNRGGATQVNGTLSSGAPDNIRLALGTLLFNADNGQLQLRYARDVQRENGYRNEGEIGIRWATFFK